MRLAVNSRRPGGASGGRPKKGDGGGDVWGGVGVCGGEGGGAGGGGGRPGSASNIQISMNIQQPRCHPQGHPYSGKQRQRPSIAFGERRLRSDGFVDAAVASRTRALSINSVFY